MKPILELLVQDIEDEIEDIENIPENDNERVFNIYKGLYKRCVNLKEEDFDNSEMYQRFIKYVKMTNNSEFITLNSLENGLDEYSTDKFSQLIDILKAYVVFIKYAF